MQTGEKRNNRDELLYEGFLRNALHHPEWIAIKAFGDEINPKEGPIREITYGTLLEKSLHLAAFLRDKGVKQSDGVAVSLHRGEEQICAVLASLLAGAFYVPVGLHQPEARRRAMIERGGMGFQITKNQEAEDAETMIDVTEGLDYPGMLDMKEVREHAPKGDATAYIIFTSGSTGEPKGVEIAHKAAMNTIEAVNELEGVGVGDTILEISALDFDLSVYDIFGMLSRGGALAILPDRLYKDAYGWKCAINRMKVTLWNSVPALFGMFLEAAEEEETFPSLRSVLLSGDWISLTIPKEMKEVTPNAVLMAMGGATEASIWSNYIHVREAPSDWTSIPYGHPLYNQKYRIVEDKTECAPGEEGEIQIGGAGVAKGYIGKPDLTKEAFLSEDDEIWYRTGDRGMIDEDGIIWFRGRVDQQVKVNGYRIELAEIEHKMNFSKDWTGKAFIATLAGTPHVVCAAVFNHPALKIPQEETVRETSFSNRAVVTFLRETEERRKNLQLPVAEDFKDYWKYLLSLKEDPDGPSLYTLEDLRKSQDLFLNVLTGKKSPVEFLNDAILAPEQVMQKDQRLTEAIDNLASRILSMHPEKVAFLCCRTGLVINDLAWRLIEAGIEVKAVDTGRFFIDELRGRTGGKARGTVIDTDVYLNLPDSFRNSFDLVLSVNGLHGFSILEQGLFASHQLLRNGGKLLALEYTAMPPEAYVTAGILERGFGDFDGNRDTRLTPLLSSKAWESVLKAMNFTDTVLHEESGILLMEAKRRENFDSFREDLWIRHAKDNLADYMVPEAFLPVSALPLSKNGKVDVKKLTAALSLSEEAEGHAPESETECMLADLWKDILGAKAVYQESSFFALGGDSLLATRFLARLRKELDVELTMNTLFEVPVLKKLAEVIDASTTEEDLEEGEI